MDIAIEVQGLSKSFGHRQALSNVNLCISAGTLVLLAGPNGAGKTTLLRILAMLTRPTTGTLRIFGLAPHQHGAKIRQQIGFLAHQTLLYDDLTAEQNLNFYARIYGLSNKDGRIRELLDQSGLLARKDELIRTFSRGMQQRLALARVLLHQPRLLLLDEPYTGLDAEAVDALDQQIEVLVQGGYTVLMATHHLNVAEKRNALRYQALILKQGHIVHAAPLADRAAFPKLYQQWIDSVPHEEGSTP
jgi:heme exporter protein A